MYSYIVAYLVSLSVVRLLIRSVFYFNLLNMENFNLKFNELLIKKGSNNTYLNKSKYYDLIVHIKQIKNQT